MRLLFVLAALLFALPTHAANIMMNNGLAPPNPANVIDDATTSKDNFYVRNVGCPPGWPGVSPSDPCPSPGDPTEISLVDGGEVAWVIVFDSSSVTMSGGVVLWYLRSNDFSSVTMSDGQVVRNLSSWGSSTVTMSGGLVLENLTANRFSSITMSGGDVMGYLQAQHFSTITMTGGTVEDWLGARNSFSNIYILGSSFEVDGVPVPYGPLSATTGILTGTLDSGDLINNLFYQGGFDDGDFRATGTITLIPEPTTALLFGVGLAGLAAAGRRRAHH